MIAVFYHLSLTVYVSCGAGKKIHTDLMLQDLRAVLMCLLYECVGLLVMLCVCVWVLGGGGGGNYSNINAGSAGETGCLLINEWSRWPQELGAGSAQRAGQVVSTTQTPGPSNKQDKPSRRHKPKTSDLCVYVSVSVYVWPFTKSTNRYVHCFI